MKAEITDWQYFESQTNFIEVARHHYLDFLPSDNAPHDSAVLEFIADCLAQSRKPDDRLLSAWAHIEATGTHSMHHSCAAKTHMLETAEDQAVDIMTAARNPDMYWKASQAWLSSRLLGNAIEHDEPTAAEQGLELVEFLLQQGLDDEENYRTARGYLNELSVVWLGLNAYSTGRSSSLILPAPGRLDRTNKHNHHQIFEGQSRAVDAIAVDTLFFRRPIHGIQVKSSWNGFEAMPYSSEVVKIAADSHLGDATPQAVISSMARAILSHDMDRVRLATNNVLNELG